MNHRRVGEADIYDFSMSDGRPIKFVVTHAQKASQGEAEAFRYSCAAALIKAGVDTDDAREFLRQAVDSIHLSSKPPARLDG